MLARISEGFEGLKNWKGFYTGSKSHNNPVSLQNLFLNFFNFDIEKSDFWISVNHSGIWLLNKTLSAWINSHGDLASIKWKELIRCLIYSNIFWSKFKIRSQLNRLSTSNLHRSSKILIPVQSVILRDLMRHKLCPLFQKNKHNWISIYWSLQLVQLQAVFRSLFFAVEISKDWFVSKTTHIAALGKFNVTIFAPRSSPWVLHNPSGWNETIIHHRFHIFFAVERKSSKFTYF